jgi:hypothetical protein
MLDWLRHLADDTRAAGFRALRFPGEAMSIFTPIPGVERFAEYESKLNSFLADQRVTVVCLYNHGRFPIEIVRQILQTHPLVIFGRNVCRNPYCLPRKDLFRPTGRRARSSGCWRT